MEKTKNIEEASTIIVDTTTKAHEAPDSDLRFLLNWKFVLMKKIIPKGSLRTNVS
jgi:hypothetical protein